MERSDPFAHDQLALPADKNRQSPHVIADAGQDATSSGSQQPSPQSNSPSPAVFLFNPFAEGYIAHGKSFSPRKHQVMLAEDLGDLPRFLCNPGDIVILAKRPSAGFLDSFSRAGFLLPEFVQLREGRIDPGQGLPERIGSLRPWAWGPDSVRLLEPLSDRLPCEERNAIPNLNHDFVLLYSKAWSAAFLRRILARWRGAREGPPKRAGAASLSCPCAARAWLCSEEEVGTPVDTLLNALSAIAVIRQRGHHRVIIKEALGLAGHNAIRLWEPAILPTQRQWLASALKDGRQVVVEPWLERELDFSIQLEMGSGGLKLCGYTGLFNDHRGQFLANWAEPDYTNCLPRKVGTLLGRGVDISAQVQDLYMEIFSMLEAELQRVGFFGPISIDALVYRTPLGSCRLKPMVEINPRYTMGRLAVELMKHTCPGSYGLFRLVNRAQARAEGKSDLAEYGACLMERFPLDFEREPVPKIREGAFCLNDPEQAQVCLATFEVSHTLEPPSLRARSKQQGAS